MIALTISTSLGQEMTNHPDRRRFLQLSALCSLALLPICGLNRQVAFAATLSNGNYYLIHQTELISAFNQVLGAAQQFWQPRFGVPRTALMVNQARAKFKSLLAGLPEVGGERNWDTQFIPIAAWYVALYQPMKTQGMSAEDVGQLIYRIYQIQLAETPEAEAKAEGDALFSTDTLAQMHAWADWTQQREYPANWVAQFIPGDGKNFDFGYDYAECGLVKYFKSQGVPELAPYVCLNDFIKSAAIGSGLERSKTIAMGDGVCNFRYRHGRSVTQSWDSEITHIRAKNQDKTP